MRTFVRSLFLAFASAMLAIQFVGAAEEPIHPVPGDFIESEATVADPVFGLKVHGLALERSVEMFQWRRVDGPAPAHYEMGWTTERIDSSGFDVQHRNPGDFPFNGERWWTAKATLQNHPVAPAALGALDAWSRVATDPTSLPVNLAATFQPDGFWLSTSQDPAHPQIGDLRVSWRTIPSAPAPAALQLVDGRWELPEKPTAVASSTVLPAPSNGTSGDIKEWLQQMFGAGAGGLVVAGVVLALGVLALRRRR